MALGHLGPVLVAHGSGFHDQLVNDLFALVRLRRSGGERRESQTQSRKRLRASQSDLKAFWLGLGEAPEECGVLFASGEAGWDFNGGGRMGLLKKGSEEGP